jgi:hypothetical protein|tara:strand:+ start:68 stop:532 length:465 start_codon:yes stop_codon:yes gene_type:complete
VSSKSKQKGYRTEYNLVKRFQVAGIDAKRQVLSGALPDHPHDIKIKNPDMIVEVKARKNGAGFKTLKRWMGSADALIMHEDHEESLVAIALPLFIDLILNHSQYKKPYEQIIKEKKKEYDKSKRAWASSKRKESNKQKRQTLKEAEQKVQQEEV